jgi:hypothetical protein
MNNNFGIDLSNCDKEPVAFIGAVQSFGALFATDKSNQIVTHASSNIKDFLGHLPTDLIGRAVPEILAGIDSTKIYSRSFQTELGHVYEFEKREKHSSANLRKLLNFMEELRATNNLQELLFGSSLSCYGYSSTGSRAFSKKLASYDCRCFS